METDAKYAPENVPEETAAAEDAPERPRKLDLSRMSPPGNLEETRLEEITIDGICGVY